MFAEKTNTHYASPERATRDELKNEIEIISKNPIVDSLLNIVSGLLAVLNEHRQIIALNEVFLHMLGIEDAHQVFGLRPGEAIKCIHSDKCDGGCGTSEYCSTCGAAISIVTSLTRNKPVERMCSVTVNKKGEKIDLYFRVQSYPIQIDKKRFLLLFLQDMTKWQQMANLEKVFFHDINNIISGLVNASELILMKSNQDVKELGKIINQFALRLHQEVKIQKHLTREKETQYNPLLQKISVKHVIHEVKNILANHPDAKNKKLKISSEIPDIHFTTDSTLILKVLTNMLINAFEATEEKGEVILSVKESKERIIFYVWNKGEIPDNISRRIFQRNFSTKNGNGRGIGTYSMKIFGEKFLGGKVGFTSSKKEGTTFFLEIPI